MKRSWWLLAIVLGALALPRAASAEGPEVGPTVLDRPPVVLEADGALWFGEAFTGVLTTRGPVTGFAFAPGRDEIAYCAPTDTEGRWGLWVLTTVVRYPTELIGEDKPGAALSCSSGPRRTACLLGPRRPSHLRGRVVGAERHVVLRAFTVISDLISVDYHRRGDA
jgi:hypothetical protein